MNEKHFTKEQIQYILKEAESATNIYEICLKHDISENTLYEWLAEYTPDKVQKTGFNLRQFMHEIFNGGITRRELLYAGATGIAGFAAGNIFAMVGKVRMPEVLGHKIEVEDASKYKQSSEELGDYLYLTPQKLGGGTHVVDFKQGITLASISYWNYGDSCPISHHLSAYPSSNPRKGFEFVNSTQGGKNVTMYSITTEIEERGLLDTWGQGNHIYRVEFDGTKMELKEDIAKTTGIGLGV
ncbi:MAG TPA: transposase, partial [Candidatus Obscuribacter sp.]|nr:transposase [Candidatus Obscuribacter sp.]